MKLLLGFVFVGLLINISVGYSDEPITYGTFPEGFAWGFATSAYQIEGGWNEDGKGESVWDWLTHTKPEIIADNTTGDVACDSYHKWQEDIQLLADAGATHYRFSIAWTRILPDGIGQVNQGGLDYYNNLINGLLEKGIQPMITLFHWDTPLALEKEGGWLSSDSPDWFEEYARVCFEEFGDRVKFWITFNEPWVTCISGIFDYRPELQDRGIYTYQCGHNIIKAHVKAYELYYRDFEPTQQGKVGITLNSDMAYPKTNSPEDVEAAERNTEFMLGWFAHVFAVNGDYPQAMIDQIAEKSSQQGFLASRLPIFTEEEKARNLGSADFFGLNHYTSTIAQYEKSDINVVDYFYDRDIANSVDPTWYHAEGVGWLYMVPYGLRALLNWMQREYGIPVYITESGWADKAGNTDDLMRMYYYKHYLNNLMKAINEDGCDVRGYLAWSLLDNMEWASGYTFSIAWTRIIPEGRGPRNQLGIDYYNNLINGLLEKGIQPMVTLFHSDTPITLEEQGGWLNPVSADWFEEYAKVCFEEFGDRVKHWITFNEPWVTCMFGIYTYKPEIEQSKGTLVYQCGHNLIKAHVQVYQLYKNMFSSAQKGLVGITLNAGMAYPKTDSREDQAAADRDIEFSLGWFANVLAANGNYPQIAEKSSQQGFEQSRLPSFTEEEILLNQGSVDFIGLNHYTSGLAEKKQLNLKVRNKVLFARVAEKSSQQGFEQSRLPSFTEEEILLNQGSVDFIGLNHYTSGLAAYQQSDLNAIDYFADRDVVNSVDPTWYQAQDVDWLYVFPPGIRDLLKWMKSRYDVPVYITECGFSDKAGNLDDLPRVYYLKHYLNHLMEAINEDGCDVKGFMAWSLMDNMEWVAGYTIKFGLHHVNFSDPERPRTAKASAKFYKQIIADNGFEPNDACPYM
ncbi:unnamed protein product [Notodromas monacha]|uniref:Beta-glucosidase n=1 Tax=Notodromas monacha TaxID=399045 RepID=A0A7R9GB56_9CRUS|nr:unnamed protein product [Notodromas monacha]CAG0915976.1 unnamed protein product [Notodromas monacha]